MIASSRDSFVGDMGLLGQRPAQGRIGSEFRRGTYRREAFRSRRPPLDLSP
ncbi:hypothetical protein HMPREF0185_03000 [Brevundimonas diminuta 470-4]|nr:hypothetical protein HMPREF0185_03000 [Brevundimonas diminuta 470-4]